VTALVALAVTFAGGYVCGVAVIRSRLLDRETRAWRHLARRDRRAA
jgi:hypothetical protein